jgi:hypothetical protein
MLGIGTNFPGLTVNGPQNGTSIPVLARVFLADSSYYYFGHTSWGQVNTIQHYAADNHQLEYTAYNLPADAGAAQSDCPRFTQRKDWAENWNNNAEAVTTYSVAADASWSQQTAPDGTIYKEFFATTGWQKGLTTSTEIWSGGTKKKWTTVAWTQDDTNLTYQKKPRITESNIYDAEGNRKRVTINYGPYASWSLPYEVIEYANDGSTILRRTYTDYNLSTAYADLRIIGLVSAVHVVDHASGAYVSKTTFDYDYGGEFMAGTPQPATQHDAVNFGAGFITGRGNLAAAWRWDVTDINNAAKAIPQQRIGYNSTGSPVFTRTALSLQTTINYADSFSDSVNRNTFAYPTTSTDPDNFSSTVQYNYDSSAVTRQQDPKSAVQTMTYDTVGRIDRVTNVFNGPYTCWVYDPAGYISRFDTIQAGAGEAYSVVVFDGGGRVRATGGDLPNSTGGY